MKSGSESWTGIGVVAGLSVILPLRQEKSWKGEWKRNLKPFEAIQRVRPPPGRGAARQPEASLAWETATSLVKRRQRMLKPCVSLEIMYPLRPSVWVGRGRCRQDRYWRGFVGSAGVLEQGKGVGWVARKPARSRTRPRAQPAGQGTPADQVFQAYRASSALVRSASANTNTGGARGACNRNHKGPGSREREVVAPS